MNIVRVLYHHHTASMTQNGVLISNVALGAWPSVKARGGKTTAIHCVIVISSVNVHHNKQVLLPSVSIQVRHEEPGNMHP